ncbi:MAG TPA: porin [Vitreimonas sp.]|uniref:porin n=1 Tax=Vitreimonas sp. TaxID=3069702 RepID=UPI002D545881|nr:porin [Vitreimonas sp.]HYD89463.1 porin [Vitreimonas sp.]
MRIREAAVLGASWLALASPAWGQTADETAARIAALEAQLAQMQAEIAALREQAAEDAAQTAPTPAPHAQAANTAPQITLANGRPTIRSADERFSFALRGTVQYDAAHYLQDDPLSDNRRSDAANPADLSSGANFRRARFGFEGTAFSDWNYALIYELGGSGTEGSQITQAYVEYAGWKPWDDVSLRFRVGAWATPAGLEDATSNTESLFLERAAVAELVRGLAGGDGRTGAGIFANGERWYSSLALTGAVVGNSGEYDEQSGYLGRLAFLPLSGENYGVHIGASATGVIDPADTDPSSATSQALRLRERPELRVDAQRFVDTGSIPSDGLTAYGFELGGYWDSLYLAGEVFQIDLSRSDGVPDPSFGGWYAQGAYTLTGERRRWNAANGGFQGIRPNAPFSLSEGDWGAWEIAARYSVLDLNDNEGGLGLATPVGGVRGGEQIITTIGLNWYPNNVVRFLLDYQWVEIDRLDPETSAIVTPVPGVGAQIGQDFEAVSLRSQVAF